MILLLKFFIKLSVVNNNYSLIRANGGIRNIMRTIHRDIATAIIFSKDGKILQGMKDPKLGGVYPGCWHIPGGGIEEGEDQMTALRREILEETGIDITPYGATLIDDKGVGEDERTMKDGERVHCTMRFNVYKVVIDDKNADRVEITLNDDLVTYRWSEISELKDMKLTPPSTALFKRLGYL